MMKFYQVDGQVVLSEKELAGEEKVDRIKKAICWRS